MAKIDMELVFSRDVASDGTLDQLQAWLATAAARWSSEIEVTDAVDGDRWSVSPGGSLRSAVLSAAMTRGETYAALAAVEAAPASAALGSAEIRGLTSELVVVVSIDSEPLRRIRGRLLLGNAITVQIRQPQVGGCPREEWIERTLPSLCEVCRPAWGACYDIDEYEARVMTRSPSFEATGRDFSRFLPALFPWNYFGAEYCGLIGRARLLGTPAVFTRELGDAGVLVCIARDTAMWASEDYQRHQSLATEHIGPQFFYDHADRDRETMAPEWFP
jgi:hypothetical protein